MLGVGEQSITMEGVICGNNLRQLAAASDVFPEPDNSVFKQLLALEQGGVMGQEKVKRWELGGTFACSG